MMKKRLTAILSAAVMAVSLLPTVSIAADAPKPVLRYTFDGKKELASENGKNELKLMGGASVTEDGNMGKGLLLDGVDGYALLPKGIISDTVTISAWVKINKFATWGRVFDLGTDTANNFFLCPYSGGTTRVEMKSPTGTDSMDAPQESIREKWVHYAVTYGDNTVSFYRNGLLIATKKNMQNLSNIKDELNYIGKSHYDADAYLSAVIDDFRIYNKTLSDSEVSQVFSQGKAEDEVIVKSYSIEDNQVVTGDKIDLPKTEGLYWNEIDNLGLIDTETEKVTHPDKTEKVAISATYGDYSQDYTVYVTGKNESPYTVNIDAADKKDVSEDMWGLFFEDINSAADGGLYAELVQNRSFEIPKDDNLYSWTVEDGKVTAATEKPLNENNPTYINMKAGSQIVNDGYMGMSVKENEEYNFSMYTRGEREPFVMLCYDNTNEGNVIALTTEDTPYGDWKKVRGTVTAAKSSDHALLVVSNPFDSDFDIDMVSLIPEDTYKGHGLRKDLMTALEAMHPKFLRFPGGCAIEGNTMETAWNWKDTVGDEAERKEMVNIWSDSEGTYQMTYGLGFYEYFQMCEDLGMEAVPILNCGMACQARSGGKTDENYLVPMDELQPYIDDALDLIEFANGTDESNEWVQLRIKMGHSEPFNMKYIGIGNEQIGDIYFERYNEFAKQIHEKYPDINLVSTSGLSSTGANNDLAWNWINDNTELVDRVDEHYYESADWFRAHAYRYDTYRRDTNSKVFLGEYASKGNAWYNALSEAAFMTGLERNADVVRMASYAPMFAKYGNTQWSAANMIWFNNDDFVLTPNYYVQSLFSNNQGDYTLPTEVTMNGINKEINLDGGIILASWGTQNEFKEVEGYNSNEETAVDLGEEIAGTGEWSKSEDGIVSQTGNQTGSTYFIDAPLKDDYTVTAKAKKLGGGEGFQIGVAAKDNLNYYRVNVGGWGNTTMKIQHIVDGVSVDAGNVAEQSYVGNVNVKENEWYTVAVHVHENKIEAELFDETDTKVSSCSYVKPKEYGPVYASSVYDANKGEIICKVVNTTGSEMPVDINIENAKISDSIAKTIVMEGDTSLENTLDDKTAIAPYASEITNAANNFTYNAPANSFTVMRLRIDDNIHTHKPYISGYTDGTFRPDNTITRAEAATMIVRIGGDSSISDAKKREYSQKFTDVSKDAWYASNIGDLAPSKILEGYPDGTFKPENSITRAEFVTMLHKRLTDVITQGKTFSDVPETHWAYKYINSFASDGYEDGTFRPDNHITRAEAVAMINRAFRRNDEPADLGNPFSDVSPSHWAYGQILEAAVSH